jgi:hypothetical protein
LQRRREVEVNVKIPELLEFFDLNRDVRRHSSAIKGVSGEELCLAVLRQYLRETYRNAEFVDGSCRAKGAQLDKWVKVDFPNEGTVHYQVEVKCWSFHGYRGGRPLKVHCTASELCEYKSGEWLRYWDKSKGRFIEEKLDKVLRPMDKASEHWEVRPLACLWAAVHPQGETEPFFEVLGVKESVFPTVSVFSVSAYLRNYLSKRGNTISLPLPDTAARLKHLAELFQTV